MKKIWIVRITAVVVLVLSLLVIENILEYKSPHGINQTRAFYEQPKGKIDVLAMGSSHVHCGINTGQLWTEYGYAAYDFSAAEQPLWITYHYLLDAYKTQNPEVVILDVFSPARFKDDYHYFWIEESIYGMPFSKNKLAMLDVAVEKEHRKEYFPAFLEYHNRYVDLNKEDAYNILGNHKEKLEFKGYTPGFNVVDQSEPFGGWEELDNYEMTPKAEEYLEKIIELTREHGSELMIIVVPYNLDERDTTTYKRIEQIATESGITFVDFNGSLNEIGIDKSVDFNDHTHLNYWGSVKFSNYLGKILQENYNLTDKRGQAGYESWDKNAENIENSVR